jgi:hypothetical protein
LCSIPDINYWAEHWRDKPGYRGATHQFHHSDFDVPYARVAESFEKIQQYFVAESKANANFDGGLLNFCFSGHGREGDGALCLADDTFLTADDFIETCLEIRRAAPAVGRMRVAVMLDSCFSGAFILKVLEAILHEHSDDLVPEYLLASSMPDEESFELPSLGHGLSTFCWSLQPMNSNSLVATAHGMPGLTWSIAAGPQGCSFVTGGMQNPIKYDDYQLETANGAVPVYTDENLDEPRSRDEWERDLRNHRDRLRDALGYLHSGGRFGIEVRRVTTEQDSS